MPNKQNIFHISVSESSGEGCLILRSEDIIVCTEYHNSSARNNFEGIITDIENVREGIEVTVDIGGAELSALITETSRASLDLFCSKMVYVSFKSNAARFIKT